MKELRKIIREHIDNLINEGRFDQFTGYIVDLIWRAIKFSKKEKDDNAEYHFKKIGNFPTVELFVYIRREKGDDLAYEISADTILGTNIMEVFIDIEAPSMDSEHFVYSDINSELNNVVRHEIEHIVQQKGKNYIKGRVKPISAKKRSKVENTIEYFLSRDEIPAMVAGFYKKAKHQKRPFDVVADEFLSYFSGDEDSMLTPKEKQKVLSVYIEYAKKNYPNVKISNKL